MIKQEELGLLDIPFERRGDHCTFPDRVLHITVGFLSLRRVFPSSSHPFLSTKQTQVCWTFHASVFNRECVTAHTALCKGNCVAFVMLFTWKVSVIYPTEGMLSSCFLSHSWSILSLCAVRPSCRIIIHSHQFPSSVLWLLNSLLFISD